MAIGKKPVTREKALERLAGLCSRSEQCESDLVRKLINWRIPEGDRREIIGYLKENRYLDETRYATSYANDKARFSAWGPSKIMCELLRRKINQAIAKEAIHHVENKVWKESLLRCAVAKSKNLDLTGEDAWENNQKLFRYLIGRGYPAGAVSKVVKLMSKKQEGEK